MKISVVIPVFNDPSALPELLTRLFAVSDQQGYDLEVLLIDDASTNDTWKLLISNKLNHPKRNIRLIQLSKNLGQHYATYCGLLLCRHDTLVTIDADLQHPPEEIPKLISVLTGNVELAYGTAEQGHSLKRRLTSIIIKLLLIKIGSLNSTKGSSFRAISSRLIKETAKLSFTFSLIDAPLQEYAKRVISVDVEHSIRPYGKSSYLLLTWLDLYCKAAYPSRELFRFMQTTGSIFLLFAIFESFLRGTNLTQFIVIGIAGLSMIVGSNLLQRKAVRNLRNIKAYISNYM